MKRFLPVCLSFCAPVMFAAAAYSQNVITASTNNPVVPLPAYPFVPVKGTISLYVLPAAGGNALPVQWTVSDESILQKSVTDPNVFTALQEGVVTVTPTGAAAMPAALILTVTPGTPVSFTVDAMNAANISTRSVSVKGTLTLTATGSYTTPSGAVNLPIPAIIQWAQTGGAGSVSITGNLLTATKAGPVVITGIDPVFPGAANPQTLNITVTDAAVSAPQFAEAPTAGNNYVKIQGNPGDIVSIYQFDAALYPAIAVHPASCGPGDLTQGHILPIITTGTTTADTSTLTAGPAPYTLAVSQALTPGTTLCIVRAGDVPTYSAFINVADPSDFGRVRTYLTVGVQINNQLSSASGGTSQSSTAGEYLETGFAYSFFRAGAKTDIKPDGTDSKCFHKLCHPGLQGLFDVQLSPTPVSAPVTTPSPAMPTTPTVTGLNLLTSQQSVKVVGELYVPFRLASWQNGYNVTTLAPLGKVGFSTLLNPTATSTSAAGTLQTVQFSSTYNVVGFGGRLAWDQYPRSTDKGPRMVTQLDVLLAKFSDLPSYSCTNDAGKGIAPTNSNGAPSFTTACGSGSGALSGLTKASRTLAYRLDIEGLAKLPNLPFVLGVRANLAQYGLAPPKNLDFLNKPGNDIRIFIGLTLPLSSLGALITTGTAK